MVNSKAKGRVVEWRSCADIGLSTYECSEFGEVRRCIPGKTGKRASDLKGQRRNRKDEGYIRAPEYHLMADNGGKVHIGAHRLVLLVFVGLRPSLKHEGCHNDGNTQNNHYTNLRWDTRKGNHADMQRHGTAVKGARNGRARLTSNQVISLRAEWDALRLENGKLPWGFRSYLKRKYGIISCQHFADIISKKLWRHI